MKQILLEFSTPQVSCHECIKTIENHISGYFNQRFETFELSQYFQYDLVSKTIQLEIRVFNDEYDDEYYAEKLIDIIDLEQVGHQMSLMSKSYRNSHLFYVTMSLLAALFWVGLSAGFWILTPFLQLIAVLLSLGLLIGVSKTFFEHAILQVVAAWHDSNKPFFNMDSLFVSTGLIIALSSILNLFFPWAPNLLEAGFFIFGFRHLGIIFQAYLDKKIGFSHSLVEMFQFRKYVLSHNQQHINAKDLRVNDRFRIQKGDVLPVDARLLSFTNDFELRDLLETGSYHALDRQCQQEYFSGVECVSGQAEFEVSKLLQDSRFAKMDEAISALVYSEKKAPILNRMDDWLQWFIPGIFLVSLISFAVISQFFPITTALTCALSVLVSACPCTLGLIVPMALRMGAYKSSVKQIFFQSSGALQKAGNVDILVMDYHGTLTQGEWQVSDFHLLSSFELHQALSVIYTIETHMQKLRPGQHLGHKINEFIENRQANHLLSGDVQDFGFGGQLKTNEAFWWFGNQQIREHLGVPQNQECGHQLYLYFQAHHDATIKQVGYFEIFDPLKKDALMFVEQMKANGTNVRICTGADRSTALLIAQQLKIDLEAISYNNRMSDKMKFLKEIKEQHPNQTLAMIGDAINDKEALRVCDLSIFVMNKHNQNYFNTHLKKSVDILVSVDELMTIADVFQIAKDTLFVIKQNLYISMAYNFLSLILAGGVFLAWGLSMPPVIGVVLMIFQSALLALNAYRVIFAQGKNTQEGIFSPQRNALTLT